MGPYLGPSPVAAKDAQGCAGMAPTQEVARLAARRRAPPSAPQISTTAPQELPATERARSSPIGTLPASAIVMSACVRCCTTPPLTRARGECIRSPRSLFRQPPTGMPSVQVIVSCLLPPPPNLISSARSIVRSLAFCPTMETILVPPLLSATLNWSPPARPTCGAKRPCSPTSRDIPSRTPCYVATYVRCWMRFLGVPSH